MDQLNIIFGIIGVLGTVFGVYSIWDSHKNRKLNSFIYEVAKMNVDKNATKDELDKLNEKRQEMNNALNIIKEQVPIEAQKAVLFDRYKIQEEQLVSTYSSYIDTQSKLKQISEIETSIPNSILNEIKQEIMPEYVVKQKKNKYLISLTVISFATSFFSSLPIIGSLARFLGVFSVVPLIGLLIVNIPANKQERKKYIKRLSLFTITILSGIVSIICSLLYYEVLNTQYMDGSTFLIVLLFTVPIFLALNIYIIIKAILIKIRRKQKN